LQVVDKKTHVRYSSLRALQLDTVEKAALLLYFELAALVSEACFASQD
jgi:hypothetical protein